MLETALKSWQNAFAGVSDGIWLLNPEGQVTKSNGKLEHLLEIKTEDVLGKYCYQIIHYTSDLIEGCPFKRMKQTGMRELTELEDKERGVWLQVTVDPIRDESGTIESIVHIVRNITELKRAEELLRRQCDELAVRARIIGTILQTRDLDEWLNIILDEMMRLLSVELGGIYLVEAKYVVLRVWRGISDKLRARMQSFPAQPAPDWMTTLCVVHERLSEEGKIFDFAKREGVQTWACVPLTLPARTDGGVQPEERLGSMILGSRRYDVLSEGDLNALQAVVEQLALAIDHARHLRETEQCITRMMVLRDVNRAISQHRSIHDVLNVVIEGVPRELGAEAMAVSLLDEDGLRWRMFAMRLPNGTVIDEEAFALSDSLLNWFVERKEPVIIYDLAQEPRVQMRCERLCNLRLVSYLGVPLVVWDKTIGVLHLLTTQPKVFAEEDLDFFSTLAGHVAIAIENARLFAEVSQAEQKYRTIFESSVKHHEASICSEIPAFFKGQLMEEKWANIKGKCHILIAEDHELSRKFLQNLLSDQGFRVTIAKDGQEALDLFSEEHYDLVVADLKMPRLDGIGLLKALKERASPPAVIVISAYATIESAVEATKEGAYGYLAKPFNSDAFFHLIYHALEERRLQRENQLLRRELEQSYCFHGLIGKSLKMKKLFRLLEEIAESQSTVLLQGESGTGKELVARAIHSMSPRKEEPFVALNCGGLAETLMESELFGHVRGAFTGAVAEKKGLFQAAHGGTLFLDEISETPPSMQVKLLRALEEGEVKPVGETRSIHVDVRFIAATNRDLEEAVHFGTFRADLFYRLNVIALVLSPLRERMEDIPLLVDHFLARHNARLKKRVGEVSPEAMACLLDYPWPGNVRELENCIERAVVLTKGEILLPEALPPKIRLWGKGKYPSRGGLQEEETRGTLEELVQQATIKALIQAKGNRRVASQILGISEPTLYRKLKAYGLLLRDSNKMTD